MTPTAHMSVAKLMGSKATTSGATNSGVPNKTWKTALAKNRFFVSEGETK